MGLLLFFFIFSIAFSFLCSVLEAVLLSITPSYVRGRLMEGSALGHQLSEFKKDIDRPLSAILTLNTIAHTVGAIGVGAQAGKLYGSNYFDLFGLHLSYESVVAGLMTLAILILSEIIPKTLGANFWKTLTPFTVFTLRILIFILYPLVWISQLITRNLKRDKSKSILSRADFTAMADVGAESGALDQSESKIIRNLLRLKDLTVRDIMTPRTVIVSAEESQTCKEFHESHPELRFSRIPIYQNTSDNVTGLVLKDEVLEQLAEDRYEVMLRDIKRPIHVVDDQMHLQLLFEHLTKNRAHIALVVDNFGSVAGLVTMEDLLETLLGMEIMDETDAVEDLQKVARKIWKNRAKNLGLIE